jgi:drug/metabolite transporter (DMT)-like permease
MSLRAEQRMRAACLAMAAVGVASAQDAIIKSIAGTFPAYEAVLLRGLFSVPILAVWLYFTDGWKSLVTPLMAPLVLRGMVLCAAYFCFILSIAAMPIANAVSIYFTMPFFVAMLAGPFLGERVPLYRWLAIIAAFIGVLVMVRPGASAFEPASIFALMSALGYAVGQMMGRHYSQHVPPIAIASIQNGVYLVVALILYVLVNTAGLQFSGHKSLAFLTRPAVVPTTSDWLLLALMGFMAAITSVMFTYAYKFAQSSFVAPFEYTAMIWAVTFGLLLFGDFPDGTTWAGMTVVVAAGLLMMWRDSQRTG